MRPDVMAELRAIMRGERVGMGGTPEHPEHSNSLFQRRNARRSKRSMCSRWNTT